MNREYSQLPKLSYPITDVRDVALAHIRAMLIKQAAGKLLEDIWFRSRRLGSFWYCITSEVENGVRPSG